VSTDVLVSKVGKGAERVQVLRRYPFVSELQRMSVLVRHTGPGTGGLVADRTLALVKGSSEVLRPRLRDVPPGFNKLQQRLTRSGMRVLCLAGKEMVGTKADIDALGREDVEGDLEFCGLLALRNAIKPQTAKTVRHLRRSYYRVVMVTGDDPLTACEVAREVNMTERPFLMLEGNASSSQVEWRSRDDPLLPPQPFNIEKLLVLSKEFTLCVPGQALELLSEECLLRLVPLVTVFARTSPRQKEQIVLALNKTCHTMMVGDGTNDVGALKQAHVGVSLLTLAAPTTSHERHETRQRLAAAGDQPPLVRLGDASIASPFTYKGDSVKCSLTILRYGHATLCTVLMMYKIMGLNSVMSALAFSVLTLDGVKLGDLQSTIESIIISFCFFLVTRSAPAKSLAKQRPTDSIFAWPVMLTLAVQLLVHLSVLYYGWTLAIAFRPKDFKRDLDSDFEPNLTNTVIFQLTAVMHASSFLANYEGRPFMQKFSNNRALLYLMSMFLFWIFFLALEVSPDFNSLFSLVPSPHEDFRQQIIMLLVADLAFSVLPCWGINTLAVWLREHSAKRDARIMGLGLDADKVV